MKQNKLLIPLFIISIILICFIPFICGFSLSDYQIYHMLIFSFVALNLFLLFILVIAEAISLKFDRTASKPTLYTTICLLLAYLFSNDCLFALSFFGVDIPTFIYKICAILSFLFIILTFYFTFLFIRRDYQIKDVKCNMYLLISLLLFIAYSLFYIFDIYIGYLLIGIFTLFSLGGGSIYYQNKIKDKDNPLPGYISLIICLYLSLYLICSLIYEKYDIFLGVGTIFILLIEIGYLLIYIHFIIVKTQSVYKLEEIVNDKIDHSPVLIVTCFHCFDVATTNQHVKFLSGKSKELFALLVILQGKALTMDKAITYLWPDNDIDKAKGLYRNAVMKLRKCFASIKIDCINFSRGEMALDTTYIKCDYYDVINKIIKYDGSPLLPEYEWSLEFENPLKNL